MPWSYETAKSRIDRFSAETPQFIVERFDAELGDRLMEIRRRAGREGDVERPLFDLPPGVAVVTDTVQVYVNIINYEDVRLDQGVESEASHARALAFLDRHYAALDRVVDDIGAQRVDFHGARLHAVIAEPAGPANERARVARGLRLAREMMELADAANRAIYGDLDGKYVGRFRVGIDAGPCVAIESGRSDEREPLFVGSPANHAAKLAEGDVAGIFLSSRVRSLFSLPNGGPFLREKSSDNELNAVLRADPDYDGLAPFAMRAAERVERWRHEIRDHRTATADAADFIFHEHRLPLRTIKYRDLEPSNSIRMPVVSIFADIDGYTAYIDHAVATNHVADAVRNLHVIRSELNAVVQDDFQGRKVRFIGDCIHGLLADGETSKSDECLSVEMGAQCAGALRASFDLCRAALPGAGGLGLAIGFEIGHTPVSRIGIRGTRSVRVASSKATIGSEMCQSLCSGEETMIGEDAFYQASTAVKAFFPNRRALNLTYDDVVFQQPGSTAAASVPEPLSNDRAHGIQ